MTKQEFASMARGLEAELNAIKERVDELNNNWSHDVAWPIVQRMEDFSDGMGVDVVDRYRATELVGLMEGMKQTANHAEIVAACLGDHLEK